MHQKAPLSSVLWRGLVLGIVLVAAARVASGQSLEDARKAFDAGDYQRVVDTAGGSPEPRVQYLVGQSQQKLRRADEARRAYGQLGGGAWGAIGRSAVALLSSDAGGAVQAADQAVAAGGTIPEAHYQRGLALSAQQNLAEAAASFQRASDLDPSWAYAHYYAGIAYSKAKRADLTASHFQTFLRLAPQAPERGEVQSILRTLGR
jgi:tetratricopeptide (TPR) repeat protein